MYANILYYTYPRDRDVSCLLEAPPKSCSGDSDRKSIVRKNGRKSRTRHLGDGRIKLGEDEANYLYIYQYV